MSIFNDITATAVVGIAGFVGLEVYRNQKAIANAPGAVAQGGVNATGGALSSIGNAVNKALGGQSYNGPTDASGAPISSGICTDIYVWRASLQPQSILDSAIQLLSPPDPTSWSQFRAWEQTNYGIDPGASPVSCWLTPPTSGYPANS